VPTAGEAHPAAVVMSAMVGVGAWTATVSYQEATTAAAAIAESAQATAVLAQSATPANSKAIHEKFQLNCPMVTSVLVLPGLMVISPNPQVPLP